METSRSQSDHPVSSPNQNASASSEKPLALVAGASRGLGFLVATALADAGHRVVLASRSADALAKAADTLVSHGHARSAVSTIVMDVSDRDGVARAVAQVEGEHGPIDVAIHVAGVIEVGPAENTTHEHIEGAMNIMAWGPINLSDAVVPGMRERGRGRFGVVTSIGGLLSAPHLLAYSTAKFAAVGYTEGLAASLAGTGVSATVIAPGLMRTGSHTAAQFYGNAQAEYAWFAPAASLPFVSTDATKAARRMVDGVLAGKPYVILTPAAKLGARVHGVMPGVTTRVMGLVGRALPGPVPGATTPVPGSKLAPKAGRFVKLLTTLGDRASRSNLEPEG
ncbi:SDR family NAD(P)-dependent oxidoreductase [Dermacoccus nishinomiyaensis]|uniref:SDR family NAD(P)-dependent oxidoreductase n=1 Tax=Dermacoccus nishinomiyaensis TaxID=1274 RepID=UPI0011A3354B|nr:SDR family NAD(P)-dependent oxidoreductase [Dermacoccus nishinomiyaensis]